MHTARPDRPLQTPLHLKHSVPDPAQRRSTPLMGTTRRKSLSGPDPHRALRSPPAWRSRTSAGRSRSGMWQYLTTKRGFWEDTADSRGTLGLRCVFVDEVWRAMSPKNSRGFWARRTQRISVRNVAFVPTERKIRDFCPQKTGWSVDHRQCPKLNLIRSASVCILLMNKRVHSIVTQNHKAKCMTLMWKKRWEEDKCNRTIYTFVCKYEMETIWCSLHHRFMYRASIYAVKKLKGAQGWALLAPLGDTLGAVLKRSGIPRRSAFTSWSIVSLTSDAFVQITVVGERWRSTFSHKKMNKECT